MRLEKCDLRLCSCACPFLGSCPLAAAHRCTMLDGCNPRHDVLLKRYAHLPHTDGPPLVSADHFLVGTVEQHAGNGLQMLDSAIVVMLAHWPSLQGRQPVTQADNQPLEAPCMLEQVCVRVSEAAPEAGAQVRILVSSQA